MQDKRLQNIPKILQSFDESLLTHHDFEKRRRQMLDIMCREVYGFMPKFESVVKGEVLDKNEFAFAGKAVHSKVNLSFKTENGEFTFPINLIVPKNNLPSPIILHIAFRPDVPDRYCPAEEIVDNGFAVASFCYQDITKDVDDGFIGGLATMYGNGERKGDSWGKISMWAFSAMRVMDYLQTQEGIDHKNVGIMGHSRLGKTALLTGALDERFAFVISNNSGCSGAAVTRGKTGERVEDIYKSFGYWFCNNYKKYIGNEENMPFDQHFLLACVAPRKLYVGSAVEDTWADPYSEYLSCVLADEAYKALGEKGFVHSGEMPGVGDTFNEGNIGYHLREGRHYLSRYDWNKFMEFMKKHKIK